MIRVLALQLLLAGCSGGDAGRYTSAAADQIPEAERYGGTAVMLHA